MATTILEQMRSYFEELDQLEDTMTNAIANPPTKVKDIALNDHFIANCCSKTTQIAQKLVSNYADRDGARRREISELSGPEMLKNFYNQLQDITKYHVQHPENTYEDEETPSVLADLEPKVAFTGEEAHGKYVDLHNSHEQWLNLIEADVDTSQNVDYLSYLQYFHKCASSRPRAEAADLRNTRAYRSYTESLANYLVGFHQRSKPLVDLAQTLEPLLAYFLKQWHSRMLQDSKDSTNNSETNGTNMVDLNEYASATELEELGLDKLKMELMKRGLKCGGSLKDRAKRLFSVKTLQPHEYPSKIRAKHSAQIAVAPSDVQQGENNNVNASENPSDTQVSANGTTVDDWSTTAHQMLQKSTRTTTVTKDEEATIPALEQMAPGQQRTQWCEALIETLAELLSDRIEATKAHIRQRQTRTWEELQQDMLTEEMEAQADRQGQHEDVEEESDSDDEQPIYNPKKVPLGWDGKPIPYWLYKLHGLNHGFRCEICGDITYYGPRDFQRHFSEWRHADGMRKLNIPNTRHFFGITRIDEAQALWKRLKTEVVKEDWNPERDEEFEDTEGNVLNRKTYEDLARQGLL